MRQAALRTKKLNIGGMACASCQSRIERALSGTAGVKSADVSYSAGTAVVRFDPAVISEDGLCAAIRRLGYEAPAGGAGGGRSAAGGRRVAGSLLIVAAAWLIAQRIGPDGLFNLFPAAEAGMGYGMLFAIGLLTSVHCVAMCGGISLSQCIPLGAGAARAGDGAGLGGKGGEESGDKSGGRENGGNGYAAAGGGNGRNGSARARGSGGGNEIGGKGYAVAAGGNAGNGNASGAIGVSGGNGDSGSGGAIIGGGGGEDGGAPAGRHWAAAMRPAALYNMGRVASYAAVGGIVGALGSAVSLTGAMRGAVQLLAGAFMVIMGANMLFALAGQGGGASGGAPALLRKLAPRLPRALSRRLDSKRARSNSPLYVGLLNGLMPCGPLQAMQLYALSAGSALSGALSMLVFSLGTVPLMFGLGALSSALSKRFTGRMMAAGGALVVFLGLSMFSGGWGLSGLPLPNFRLPPASSAPVGRTAQAPAATPAATVEGGVQLVQSTLSSGRYPAITVAAGIPVRWTIDAPKGSINGCNGRMVIPEYGIEHTFQAGENVIEFTPESPGRFAYSCWMGMIRSTITVAEAE